MRLATLVFPTAVLIGLVTVPTVFAVRDLWTGADCGPKFTCGGIVQITIFMTAVYYGTAVGAGALVARAYVRATSLPLARDLALGLGCGLVLGGVLQAVLPLTTRWPLLFLFAQPIWFAASIAVCISGFSLARALRPVPKHAAKR